MRDYGRRSGQLALTVEEREKSLISTRNKFWQEWLKADELERVHLVMKLLKNTMRRFWSRISNRDRLAYFMVIVFGLAFLMETLYFQFGNTVVTLSNGQQISLGGYIGEPRLWVRIIEGVISLSLITLGIERVRCLRGKGDLSN